MKHNNCKLNITHVFSNKRLVPCTTILNTEAGTNLASANLLSTIVLGKLQPCTITNLLVDAKKLPLAVRGSMHLVVAVETVKFLVRVIVLNQFATDFVLGSEFIDNYIKAIMP